MLLMFTVEVRDRMKPLRGRRRVKRRLHASQVNDGWDQLLALLSM